MPPQQPPNEAEVAEGEDPDLSALIRAFDSMGFDHWTAFLLAWQGCSPSQARELMRKGCPMDLVPDILV